MPARYFDQRPVGRLHLVLLLALGGLMGSLVGCSTSSGRDVEVVDRKHQEKMTSGFYNVKSGDTLWSIAFRFGWDWKELAWRNGIPAPYVIHPGERIYFDEQGQRLATSQRKTQVVPSVKTSVTNTVPTQNLAKAEPVAPQIVKKAPAQPALVTEKIVKKVPEAPLKVSNSGWAWPVQGPLLSRFVSGKTKGIDIGGSRGQKVYAASKGSVVYAGSGLIGYGELVIIKHDDTFISAYGHNQKLLVREGQQVKAGQEIAEMGASGTDHVKLHFEIRRNGDPVDPLKYLPSL